jgi:hypothetical protein
MPIHLEDVDVVPEVVGLKSALIVPCNFCPAVTVSHRVGKPFLEFFKGLLKCIPYDQYIKEIQSRLKNEGVVTKVFRSNLLHQYVMCIWSSGRRKQLLKRAKQFDAVIVLGCESATESAREAVRSLDCKVIQGMKVVGFLNAKPRIHIPLNVSFVDSKVVPLPQPKD